MRQKNNHIVYFGLMQLRRGNNGYFDKYIENKSDAERTSDLKN